MTSDLLTLEHLDLGYRHRGGRRVVLAGVDATAASGRLIALVGPNGAGKSTLLRTVAGLQPSLAGRTVVAGHQVGSGSRVELARCLAVVLTDRVQVDHLGVDQLVDLGRHPHRGRAARPSVHDAEVVAACLARVGAAHLRGRLFSELSDGQRQRVMVARALAQEPSVLLLDEPTSFLDPTGRIQTWALLRELADSGLCLLVCTHEVELALDHADALWVASSGEVVTGSPSEVVDDGLLARAFAADGVRFNPSSRRFEEAV